MNEKLQLVECLILLGLLGGYSWEDFRKHSISAKYLVIPAVLGMILRIVGRDLSIISVLLGVLVGGGILLMAFATGERIGLGDGMLLMVTGIYLGGAGNLQLLMNGLFYAAVFSLAVLALGKWRRSREIPFVPFLFLGYLTMIVGELL